MSPWHDVRETHMDQRYHRMLGGEDQVYTDFIKIKRKEMEGWLNERNILKKLKLQLSEEP